MAHQPAGHIKIHRLRVPQLYRPGGVQLLQFFAIILVWGVTFLLLRPILRILWANDSNEVVNTGSTIIALVTGPVLYVLAADYLRRRRLRRANPFREPRLRAISALSDAWTRVPHRMLELSLRYKSLRRRRLVKLCRQIPGNSIIVLSSRGDPLPVSTSAAFEPIDIFQDAEQLGWLIVMNLERARGTQHFPLTKGQRPKRTIGVRLQRTLVLVFRLVFFMLLVESLYLWISGGRFPVFMVIYAAIFALTWASRFRRRGRYFLVPGAFVRLRQRWLGNSPSIDVFARASGSFIFNLRDNWVVMSDSNKAVALRWAPQLAWCLMAALFNTSRTPTLEELKMYLLGEANR